MKDRVYRVVVDTWRLAAKYGFRKMGDSDWKDFIENGKKLVIKYRAENAALEKLCRDILDAFQTFFKGSGIG
jgi:hypothetical protein